MSTTPVTFLRCPQVIARIGRGRSTFYADIQNNLFPPPVKLGVRASGWPEHEIDAIIRARIAGKSDGEIRDLVADLVKRRGSPA